VIEKNLRGAVAKKIVGDSVHDNRSQ
ncbi:uncharacterized protein METZ01_LOCUS270331, partial [marine metagenome]